MDPVTQGTLGAALALGVLGRSRDLRPSLVALAGALGGMAADLDVLIQSSDDPLLAVEYHRHFTHSLLFAPLGGLLTALPLTAFRDFRKALRPTILATILGFLTHGPLDCFTTYGTVYFWPISDYRVALSWISIVDLYFTLPLLLAVIVAARRGAPTVARWGLLFCLVYLGLGALQKHRALDVQKRLSEKRGHHIERSDIFPSFMNQVAWRSVYRDGENYYVDQIRVPFIGRNCITQGASLRVVGRPPERGPEGARAERLLRWFSNGWVAYDPADPSVLGDLRYSFSPYEVTPIWGIRIDQAADRVEWVNNRPRRGLTLLDLKNLMFEDPPGSFCE